MAGAILRKVDGTSHLAGTPAQALRPKVRSLAAVLILFVGACSVQAQPIETYNFLNLNSLVPDGTPDGLSDVRLVTSLISNLASVRVRVVVAGEFNGDLFAYLRQVHDAGTNYCVLLNRPGRTAATPFGYDDSGMDVMFDDAAADGNIHNYRSVTSLPPGSPLLGTWRPDGRTNDPRHVLESDLPASSLASFAGAAAHGEWTLFVADLDSGGTNMLLGWELELTGMPVLDHVAYVLMPLVITNRIADFNPWSGPLTFGLGAGAPAGAWVNPTNGVFLWKPSREQAASFHVISVWVTDSGSPPASATNTFAVRVDDYAELNLGRAVVLAGQASSVPVTLQTSAALTNVQATVEVPEDRITSLALMQWAPEVGTALLSHPALNVWRLEFQAAPGQVFRTSQELAQLSFLAVSNTSAFVPFVGTHVSVVQEGGAGVGRTFAGPGRAAVVERQPLLEALRPVSGQPNLVLYGIPGHEYDLLAASTLAPAGGWALVWQGTMPGNSLWMPVVGLPNGIAPELFFRAEDRFGQ